MLRSRKEKQQGMEVVIRYCGFFARRVQPWLLYLIVERISLARQMRSTRLSLTWIPWL